ncbi:MAG TPA: NAD(P)/FAD-dependent oxidoreductase [Rugosimonospora sp.]|nr:NAD(P)/FAD-dependent oxidoreductase [Rugosimonospora sp.]
MRSAVVVGAGVGGLAVAGALARTGWQVTLLERGDRLRGDSAALLIWPEGVRALRALDLGDGLGAIASPVPSRGIRRPNGQWLVQPDLPSAEPDGADTPGSVVVHREDLHDTLVAGLTDRIDIRTGIAVRTVRLVRDESPAVTDGRTTWTADLVVGADGVDSIVRRRLAPEATAVAAGCAAWRAVIPWYRAPKFPDGLGTGGETLGGGHRFRYALLGERGTSGGSSRGGVYWAATVPGAYRPEPPATQLSLLRRWFADWHAPIGDLLAATEPEDLIQHSVAELRPVPRSFTYPAGTGGYVLLGDAAHAMSHHLGQGACLALEDAASLRALLLDAVPGRTLGTALDAYTRERRPRLARIMRQSRRVGAMMTSNGSLAGRARDAALGLSPSLLGRVLRGSRAR